MDGIHDGLGDGSFFRATPSEVLAAPEKTEARDYLLEFTELAEAPEWRASQTATPITDES